MDERAAEKALGGDVIASCPMIPSGYGLRVGVRASGAVSGGAAGVIASAGAAERMRKETAPGDHEGDLYLAVGRDRVAIFEMKRGLLKKSLGELLVQFDRGELQRCDFRPARVGASSLDLELADGTRYELQAACVHRKKAERVHQALAGDGR